MDDSDTQVNDFFLHALKQTEGAERQAYLDAVCGSDASLPAPSRTCWRCTPRSAPSAIGQP